MVGNQSPLSRFVALSSVFVSSGSSSLIASKSILSGTSRKALRSTGDGLPDNRTTATRKSSTDNEAGSCPEPWSRGAAFHPVADVAADPPRETFAMLGAGRTLDLRSIQRFVAWHQLQAMHGDLEAPGRSRTREPSTHARRYSACVPKDHSPGGARRDDAYGSMRDGRRKNLLAFWRAWVSRGGEETFESLTQPHVDALWRTAFRMTGDRDAADDLTQEACLKAYRSFSRFKTGSNYRAWIFRILTNLCLDHLRREKRSPVVHSDVEMNVLESGVTMRPEHDPDAQVLRREIRSAVRRAMSQLTPEIRLVVSLALLEGRTYREIAEIVGCPVGTVRSRLSRGRQQLRRTLQGHTPARVVYLRGSDGA